MFHTFKILTDARQPRRGLGLLSGGAIVASGLSIANPAGILAAKGSEGDPPALAPCAGEAQAADLHGKLRARYIDLRKETLALERERNTLKAARETLSTDLESLRTLRKDLDAHISSWEQRRDADREARLARLVNIVSEMPPDKAAALILNTDDDLAVDLLIKLDAPRSAQLLALLPAERAASMANAITDRKP